MDHLHRFVRGLRDGVRSLMSEPDIAIKLVEAADTYNAAVDRWKFVRLLVDIVLTILFCCGVFVFGRILKTDEVGMALDTIILGCIVCLFMCATLAFRHYIDVEERRCKQKFIRESVYTLFRVASIRIRSRNEKLNTLANETKELFTLFDSFITLLAPIVAICAPGWHSWWRFNYAISQVDRKFETVSGIFNNICQFLRIAVLLVFYRTRNAIFSHKKKTVGAVFVAIIALAYAWKRSRDNSSSRGEVQTRVVPKRKQEISDDTSDCPPASVCTSLADISGSSRFKGTGLVYSSLVRVKAAYVATAFRTGNFLVTAIHCLGYKNKHSEEKGIWVENPQDRKYYWAPLEQQFINEGTGDGVAVCSLPNSEYFILLKSCSLSVHKDEEDVMTFTCDVGSRAPTWTISVGMSYYSSETGLCYMFSTVKPGSSGGPIVNVDGSVVAIVYAETTMNGEPVNVGIAFDEEVRSFLVSGGAAKPSLSADPLGVPLDTECIETIGQDESLKWQPPISSVAIPGPIREKYLKFVKSKNSSGLRRKKPNKKKEQSPPLQPDQEHPES